MENKSPKLDKSLFPDEFWALSKSQKNKYHFSEQQKLEICRARHYQIPKDLAEELGCGVYKIHKVVNSLPKSMRKFGKNSAPLAKKLIAEQFEKSETSN